MSFWTAAVAIFAILFGSIYLTVRSIFNNGGSKKIKALEKRVQDLELKISKEQDGKISALENFVKEDQNKRIENIEKIITSVSFDEEKLKAGPRE